MKRWTLAAAFALACAASAAAGYWFGFREAYILGIVADSMPRGSIAVAELKEIRSGKTQNLVTALEFDVDSGLISGYDYVRHPLRDYLGPVWGFGMDYQRYATRLADYRKEHASPMKPDIFDTVPPGKEEAREYFEELARGARESVRKRNSMVEQYATKP